MSRFNDENENEHDSDDFDSPDETDSLIWELRSEIIRLEAQLDQLTASVREQTEESIAISVRLAELEAAVERLRARQRRDTKLLFLAWMMVVASVTLSLFSFFTT
ncbi:MAG TPA: hypothetical protein VGE74_15255 [Gemmata sp.]